MTTNNSSKIKSLLLSILLFVLVASIAMSQTLAANAESISEGENKWVSSASEITKTDAVIDLHYYLPSGHEMECYSEYGFTLCDEDGNVLKEYVKKNLNGKTRATANIHLKVSDTLQYTLEAGKTYKYKGYFVFPFGKFESPSFSFSTLDPSMIDISKLTLKVNKTKFVYTGKQFSPKATIDGLKEGEDYKIGYIQDRKCVGVFWVSAVGVGKCYGSNNVACYIYPKKEAITKLTATKNGFTVKWKKDAKARMAGYQIQYSLHSNFRDSTFVDIDDPSQASEKITELKSKKTYYVRVRSCGKFVDIELNSAWSDVKKVKTK